MTNKVSFIIQFKDKFSRTSADLNRQFKKIDDSAAKAGARIKKMSAESRSSIKRLGTVASTQFKKIKLAARSVSFDNIERGAKRATDRFKELGKRGENIREIGKGIAGAGAVAAATFTLPAVLIGKSLVNAASGATETTNKFNTVFENVKVKANAVASEFAKSFGVAESTSRKLLGSTGDLLVGLGLTEKGSLDMSKQVVELAADLASFQNLEGGTADAADRLTKALTGETESLKMIGIVIRQDTKEFKQLVKQTMFSQRISRQAAKAQVILAESVKQSKKSIGDVARTWMDYANVVRRASEKNIELKETFGQHLIPLATILTNAFTKLADVFIELSPNTQKFLVTFVGLTAVMAPLVAIVGGLFIAFSLASTGVLLIGGAIVALIAGLSLLIVHWKKVTQFMADSMNIAAAIAIGAIVGIVLIWQDFKTAIMGVIESIGMAFTALWEGRFIDSIKNAVNVGVKMLNQLLTPVSAVSDLIGFGQVKIPEFNVGGPSTLAANDAVNAPSAPLRGGTGTLNGQITVAAEPGTTVKSTKLKSKGSGLNVGMNMRAL